MMLDYVCNEDKLKTQLSYAHETETISRLIQSLSLFWD
jgi:hypothetical protein